jgi:hypothetical protein
MWNIRAALAIAAVVALSFSGVLARADAAFLMEEPYGKFGAISPTGHAAIYLDHICAESPTRLRLCQPDETGVVISRYRKIGGYDWLAIPVVPYFYAVEHLDEVPGEIDPAHLTELRNQYRRDHLMQYASDTPEHGEAPGDDWAQLIGASYIRTIYGFQIQTTLDEDERIIAKFNDRSNVSHFNLFFHNCADFSRVLLNTYYPHAVHRNVIADLGMTTPKQVASSLTKYAKRHPELEFSTFMIPQVQGSTQRSTGVRGVAEALVKSKKYVVPLALLNPELTAGLVVTYLTEGRYELPKKPAKVLVPEEQNKKTANGVNKLAMSGGTRTLRPCKTGHDD